MDFPPYVYRENEILKGFNVDILKEIFQRMNTPMKISLVPWARGVKMVENGTVDAIFPFFKNEKRLKFTDYSNTYTSEDTALFVLKNSPIQWDGDLLSLSKYTFGRVRGFSSGPQLDPLIESGAIRVEEAVKTVNNIKKLLAGRFDIMVEERHVALYELKKMGRTEDMRQLTIIHKNLSYLGFSKKRKRKTTIEKFNKALREMKEDGSYQKIMNNSFRK